MADWNGIELGGLVLHTGRLTLRPWQPGDAVAVEQLMADERIGRYLPLPRPYTSADAVDFVSDLAVAGRQRGDRIDCAVLENSAGRLVGSASLALPAGGRSDASIGYWLGTEFWGRGYITEAVQALTRFGFGNGLPRIRIICRPANIASARVALRAGYRFESIARAGAPGRHGARAAAHGHHDAVDVAVFARLPGDSGEPIPPAWPAPPPLTDGVVTLRPVRAEDWPVVLAEATNELSLAWGFGGEPLSEAAAIERCAAAPLEALVGRQLNLLICDAATGVGAGTLSLRWSGPPDVAGIGYGILPGYRGRRFTSRALRLVSDWALGQTSIARLELGCKVDNVASARSAEAAGFEADARYRQRLKNPDGSYSDEIGYGKVRTTGSR